MTATQPVPTPPWKYEGQRVSVARVRNQTYHDAFAAGHGGADAELRAGAEAGGSNGSALQPEVAVHVVGIDTKHGEQSKEGAARCGDGLYIESI